jgi:hypothetical protein
VARWWHRPLHSQRANIMLAPSVPSALTALRLNDVVRLLHCVRGGSDHSSLTPFRRSALTRPQLPGAETYAPLHSSAKMSSWPCVASATKSFQLYHIIQRHPTSSSPSDHPTPNLALCFRCFCCFFVCLVVIPRGERPLSGLRCDTPWVLETSVMDDACAREPASSNR